jgi:hypothetical protein
MTELTIGFPVYNGAATMERSLDALLTQSHSDFTLLASDNASTDATPDILARYARLDSRVQVVRQHVNIGAEANYWYLLRAAQTRKFGWFAADDVAQPSYIERCVAGLDAAPSAILCCTDVIFVLINGERWKYIENLDTVGCDLDARLHRLMNRHGWYATYGIGWRKRLLDCGKASDRYGADVTQVAQWLCSWDVACVHEPLLHFLFVPKDAVAYARTTSSKEPVALKPFSQMLGDIGAAVRARVADDDSRDRVVRVLARTLAFENRSLCETVLREHGLRLDMLDNAQRFAIFHRLFANGGNAS